jgi:acetyltransferase-like isoleucine patch superfamily enzyme
VILRSWVEASLSKSRLQPTGEVGFNALVGWYLRKGLLSGIRGLSAQPRWDAKFPLFLGARCSISYARHMRTGRYVVLGKGSTINALSVSGVEIGDRVTVRENAWIQCSSHPSNPGVGLIIGDSTYIGPSVIIGVGGQVRIGSNCQIGSGVTLVAENHAVDDSGQPSPSDVIREGIEIGDNCWIGHRATILDGVILGENCVVGAGAVVTKSFPAGSRIAGVPARAIGT